MNRDKLQFNKPAELAIKLQVALTKDIQKDISIDMSLTIL